MEKAKQAIKDFVPTGGKHHTTLDQDVRGAVTDEHVLPHRHENVTTAVDKEVHQDHHHTVVQPIKHKETLPEQHTHNIVPVEHRSFEHGNDRDVKATLERDAAQFKNKSVTHETTHSKAAAPIVAGERTYHHVHEHIQPVIQKETIQPTVVHTTIPIHETHHAATLHHGTSTLPAKTLEEFSRDGGKLQGRGVQHLKEFEGCPTSYKENMQSEQLAGDKNMHLGRENVGGENVGRDNIGRENIGAHNAETRQRHGDMATMAAREADATTGTGSRKAGTLGREAEVLAGGKNTSGTRDSGVSMGNSNSPDSKAFFSGEPGATGRSTKNTSALGSEGPDLEQRRENTYATPQNTEARKPSLMDKINPLKDADGDGKRGFMR